MKTLSRQPIVLVIGLMVSFFCLLSCFLGGLAPGYGQALNPNPPPTAQRLVFIHHSVGEAWLTDDYGNLLRGLNTNNYYVSDTYYEWGPYDPDIGGPIGDYTDVGQWYLWFLGPRSTINLDDLYTTTHLTPGEGTNSLPLPAGPNTVIMFKSCFPNSATISGNPNDPPRVSSPSDPNPIWGSYYGELGVMTVTNIKGLYRDLLQYFATRQDKLFILVTSPPVTPDNEEVAGSSNRARAINTWLVHHWLDNYPYNNVAVFDFFNVLTSNGGDPDTNDLGAATGNHHRLGNGQVQHVIQTANNYAAYPSGDSHPTAAGDQKARGEYLPLLNVVYHAWKGTGGRPWFMGRSPGSAGGPLLLLLD